MKKLIQICSLLSLIVAFSFLSANAQTKKIEAQIPFDFSVAGKNYPAGTYHLKVTDLRSPGAVVYLTDGADSILDTLLVSVTSDSAVNEPKLVFNNYEGHRFLSKIQFLEAGYRVTRSRVERQIASGEKAAERKPEVVALALKTEL